MSNKADLILSMLDEVLMRMDRIERHLGIETPKATPAPRKPLDKPVLSIVKNNNENVVDFRRDDA